MNCNIFEGLNDWNIIILATQTKNENIKKDDEEFKTILRGVETRMSKKILTTMYGAMRTDNERTDGGLCPSVNKCTVYTTRRQRDEWLYTNNNSLCRRDRMLCCLLKSCT